MILLIKFLEGRDGEPIGRLPETLFGGSGRRSWIIFPRGDVQTGEVYECRVEEHPARKGIAFAYPLRRVGEEEAYEVLRQDLHHPRLIMRPLFYPNDGNKTLEFPARYYHKDGDIYGEFEYGGETYKFTPLTNIPEEVEKERDEFRKKEFLKKVKRLKEEINKPRRAEGHGYSVSVTLVDVGVADVKTAFIPEVVNRYRVEVAGPSGEKYEEVVDAYFLLDDPDDFGVEVLPHPEGWAETDEKFVDAPLVQVYFTNFGLWIQEKEEGGFSTLHED